MTWKSILKTSLPILAVGLLAWVIFRYLKPSVYDIKVPEQIFENNRMEPLAFQSAEVLRFTNGLGKWDSISLSSGLEMSRVEGNQILITAKGNMLPLQWIGYWKNGFKYTQIAAKRRSFPDDTCCLYGSGYLSDIGFWDDPGQGVFKENFDGQEIILRLEKKQPKNILALWENFVITGETNGELIKIKVPASANNFKTSMIRVWCCDDTKASPVCEIPLLNGVIPERFSQVSSLKPDGILEPFNIILSTGLGLNDSIRRAAITGAMEEVVADQKLALSLGFGDVRCMQAGGYDLVIYNYFGRKLLVILNRENIEKTLEIPVKGDFKHSANGSVFKSKGGKISLKIPAMGFEILY